jgi:hypothetical protein
MFKPNNKMKSITLSILGLAAITASFHQTFHQAFADDQPQTAVDSQAQVGATLNATADSIQQILDKMSAQKPHDSFQHADYLAKSARNQGNVQSALNNFKNVLATDILPKLESYMADYNSIATSTSYSDAQKSSLLLGLKNQINGLVPGLQAQYQMELLKLYSAAGMNLIASTKSLFLTWTVACLQDGNSQVQYRDDSNSPQTVFADDIFPALADDCLSQSCISLSAVDQMLLYSLIQDDFERTLTYKLADGTEIDLRSNQVPDGTSGCTDQAHAWSALTQEAIKLIGRAELYPASVAQLPFDATAGDLKNLSDPSKKIKVPSADTVNKEARATSLQAIADKVGGEANGNYFEDAENALIAFCNAEAYRYQCMNSSEADDFIKAIFTRKGSDYPKYYEKNFRYILSQKSSQKYYGTDDKGRAVAH